MSFSAKIAPSKTIINNTIEIFLAIGSNFIAAFEANPLNIIMMIVAFYVAQLLATGNAQKKCIAIECGLHNGTLAIFVGTTLFGGGAFVIPAATYSLIMFATSLIFVFLVKNN